MLTISQISCESSDMKTRVHGFDKKTIILWCSWPVLYIPVSSYSKLHRKWTIFRRFFLWCWEGEQMRQISCGSSDLRTRVYDFDEKAASLWRSWPVPHIPAHSYSKLHRELIISSQLSGQCQYIGQECRYHADLHFRVPESDISDMPLMSAKFCPEIESPPHFQSDLTRVL